MVNEDFLTILETMARRIQLLEYQLKCAAEENKALLLAQHGGGEAE